MLLPHLSEKDRAVALAIEEQSKTMQVRILVELLLAGLPGDVLQQSWDQVVAENLQHALIHRPLDDEERLSQSIVDPVVGGTPQAQALPSHITGRRDVCLPW